MQHLREHLKYCPDTGKFTRLIKPNNRAKMEETGYINKLGYVQIRVDGKRYYAHRLAFFFMNEEIPEMVDHIDGNPSNNSWSNLRAATPAQNTYNRKLSLNNKSGVKGVCWNKSLNKWQAGIKFKGKQLHIGVFETIDAAAEAVRIKRLALHNDFSNNG